MKGYVVILCLALASGSCWAQLPGAPAAAASAAAVGAAIAAASAGGAGGDAPPADLGGAIGPGMTPNQQMGQRLINGAELGRMGSNAGFQIAQASLSTAEQMGSVIPIIGTPLVSMVTRPASMGTMLGQTITGTSLDLTRQVGEMMMNDQLGGGILGHLANKMALKHSRFGGGLSMMPLPPAGDPMALMDAGGLPPGVDPAMLMGLAGQGAAAGGVAASAVAG